MNKRCMLLSTLLLFSLLLPLFAISGMAENMELDRLAPYETVTPTAITTIYLNEYLNSGHGSTDGTMQVSLVTSWNIDQQLELFETMFDIDSQYGNFPTYRKHLQHYSEEFFESHILIIIMSETHHYLDTGEPAVPARIGQIYIQDGQIFIERLAIKNDPSRWDSERPMEYHYFIEIEKKDLVGYEIENWDSVHPNIKVVNIVAPQTADPTLSLLAAITTAALLSGASAILPRRRRNHG